MKLPIAAILDFVALTLFVLVSISMISMHLNTQAARNFHALAVDEIENSNFSNGIITGLKAEADRMGYKLSIKEYKINDRNLAEVTLDYTYNVPLLNIINKPQAIRGTAR